jgi:hypothetical protein
MTESTARRGFFDAGIPLIAGGVVCGEAAWLHMRSLAQAYGVICGAGPDGLAHCPACYASVLLLAAGAAALTQARGPQTPARAASRPPGDLAAADSALRR